MNNYALNKLFFKVFLSDNQVDGSASGKKSLVSRILWLRVISN